MKFSFKSRCPRCTKQDTCVAWRRIHRAEKYMYMAVSTDPVTSSTALVTFECKAFTGIEKNVKNDVYPINPAHETVPLNPGMALEAPE